EGLNLYQIWTWTLFSVSDRAGLYFYLFACRQYMVAIPAVLEAGSETKFCASLLQPSGSVVMTVTLVSGEESTTLLNHTSSEEFHMCTQFKVPLVQNIEVQKFQVEVGGDTFYSKEVRKVMIKVYQPMTFVQTDKPLYLPGQTVHFRVITLDTKFRPINQMVSDANGNRLGQWINVTSNSKILQLSYSLNSEACEGNYEIIVSVGENQISHNFKVEKFVLPKFDVQIITSDEVSIEQEDIKAEVCAKYTYGQFVRGSVKLEVCRPVLSNPELTLPEGVVNVTAPCYNETKQVTFPQNGLAATSGISHQRQKNINISYVAARLSFIETPRFYHQGSNVEGKVSVVFTLSANNKTPTWEDPDHRTAHYRGEHRFILAYSTGNSVKVKKKDKPLSCDTEEDIFIQYTVVGEAQGKVDVMYLVTNGSKQLVFPVSVNEGEVSFKLKMSPEMAPEVQIVAYAVLPNEKMFANSADFSTEKCFSHKVSLEFSPSPAVPGEEVIMQVSADPDSLCGVSTVDQSVLIKKPGKSLNSDQIFNLLPVKKISYIPHEVRDSGCVTVRAKRNVWYYLKGEDAYDIFEEVGLKMATNVFIRIPSCVELKGIVFTHGESFLSHLIYIYEIHEGSSDSNGGSHYAPQVLTVHTFFPKTWIWELVDIGESGTKDVSLTAPDTITTLETEAFCLSPQGFGLAPRKEIRVFPTFFLELSLPYSVIQGEHFELKATTFNHLTSCIMISVTPAPSLDYTLTPLSGDQYTSCLCGNGRKTLRVVNVSVTAEAVASHATCDNEIVSVPDRGRIDKVTKSLIVKAEGTEIAKAFNWLLCPKGEALTEEINIQLPENVIDGSARASVSVLGDILGRALQNLDGLLRMPYGCGEQNMALLAPNIYILQYLKNTHGYHRQLNYKHNNSAYSTFGSGPENTWLTAFVLRSFTKAQTFIYIDPENIEESKTWLKNKQRENGCFEQSGKLFNNRMKGGVSDEVTLTAYITAAFLEMNMSAESPVTTKSLSCLKESISDLSNTYTTALLAYVFTLAGDMETRAHLLQHLDTVASKQGGFLHWSQTAAETSASLSVEISSYVLLAKLSASPTNEELGYSSGIVRWLTGQQNYYGGFSSTQDTVVALQALALYSTLVFSREGSSTVTVQSPSGQLTFDVNQDNKLLYQEKMLQDTTGKYSLEVKGTACASVQISLHYNIPTPPDVTTLSVEVKPEADCNSESPRPKLTLKYSGKLDSTNMVILDIKMLSGFVMITQLNIVSSQLKRALFVDRVEEKDDHVLMYIQQLPKDKPINHQLEIVQEIPVQNLKPAVVKIYDYYQPSKKLFIPPA
uniref:Alpha-2-macroglobulin bait region domain-containing protein n=1 Tax=Anabas testudineus TaxID=64144 RepID=A0A3Q1J6W2_ANATE